MSQAVVKKVELNGYTFGIRKVSAMETFRHGISEANVWVLSLADLKSKDDNPLQSTLDSSVKWIRLGVVWGKRPGSDAELPVWVPLTPAEANQGPPPDAIDIDIELEFDFLTLAAAVRDVCGLTGDTVAGVNKNFFRIGLLGSDALQSGGNGETDQREPGDVELASGGHDSAPVPRPTP